MATFVLLVLVSPIYAADILGRWIARVPDTQALGPLETFAGMLGETVFDFKVDGTKLTGTVTYPQGEAAINEGKIDGNEISFIVKRDVDEKEIKMIYKGKAGLNEISFTSEVQSVSGKRQEFTAEREFRRHNDLPLQRTITPVPPPK